MTLVGGSCGILPIICVLPYNLVLGMSVKLKVMDDCPEGHKLANVFQCEVLRQLDLGHPSIVGKSLLYLPLFPNRCHKNVGRNVLGLPVVFNYCPVTFTDAISIFSNILSVSNV